MCEQSNSSLSYKMTQVIIMKTASEQSFRGRTGLTWSSKDRACPTSRGNPSMTMPLASGIFIIFCFISVIVVSWKSSKAEWFVIGATHPLHPTSISAGSSLDLWSIQISCCLGFIFNYTHIWNAKQLGLRGGGWREGRCSYELLSYAVHYYEYN